MGVKSLLQSKTFWIQVMALLAVIAGTFNASAAAFIQEHFSAMGGAWAMINIVLRVITKEKVQLLG